MIFIMEVDPKLQKDADKCSEDLRKVLKKYNLAFETRPFLTEDGRISSLMRFVRPPEQKEEEIKSSS